ncbi:unnamed protein product [Closterium sp. NIES-64]|nr:unnamed protein product [Closterium sp. NIES-64]
MVDRTWVLQNPITVFFFSTKVSKAAEGAAYTIVSMVVPYYNSLIDTMESRLAKGPSATLKPMIVAALGHLKKYVYITSNEYRIAIFLDPSMKAVWFDDANWETLHLDTHRRERSRPTSGKVITLVREHVVEYQARAAELAPQLTTLSTVAEEEEGGEGDDEDDRFLPSCRRLVTHLSGGREGLVQDDEVCRYLSEWVQYDVTATKYWRTATNMQTLRLMARNYFTIPATSAASERVISLGRNLISWKRHRLGSERTRSAMIPISWCSSHPGQRIGEGRRPRGVTAPEFAIKGEEAGDDEEFAIEGEGSEDDKEEEEEEADVARGGDGVVGSSGTMSHAPYAPSPSRAPCSVVARSPHLPCPASSHTLPIVDACSLPIVNAHGLPIIDARARPAIDVRVPTAHRCPSPCRPALPPRGRPPLPSRGRPASPPCRHLPLPSWYASICLVYPTSALSAHSICLFNIPLLSSLHPPLCASPSFFLILPLRICYSCLLVAAGS